MYSPNHKFCGGRINFNSKFLILLIETQYVLKEKRKGKRASRLMYTTNDKGTFIYARADMLGINVTENFLCRPLPGFC